MQQMQIATQLNGISSKQKFRSSVCGKGGPKNVKGEIKPWINFQNQPWQEHLCMILLQSQIT